jgi:hypothetical protein
MYDLGTPRTCVVTSAYRPSRQRRKKYLPLPRNGRLCCSRSVKAWTMWRRSAPMDPTTAAVVMLAGMFTYSAWLTSIVFCSAHSERPLLIAAVFFPVGVVHGIGIWFGGWRCRPRRAAGPRLIARPDRMTAVKSTSIVRSPRHTRGTTLGSGDKQPSSA